MKFFKAARRVFCLFASLCVLAGMMPPALAASYYDGVPVMRDEKGYAFAQVLQDAVDRGVPAGGEWEGQIAEKQVLATFVGYDEEAISSQNCLLWICGILIYDREREWPLEIPMEDGRCFEIMYEQVWDWDGEKAVQFKLNNDDSAYAALRPDGMEFYTCYGGTDVGGQVWDAFYPFENNRLSREPAWCRASAWLGPEDMRDEGIQPTGGTIGENARLFFTGMAAQHKWPSLPFDWDTLSVGETMEVWESYASAHVTVSGGEGFEELYPAEDGYMPYPSVSNASGLVLTGEDVLYNSGRWVKAETIVQRLVSIFGFVDIPEGAYYVAAVGWAAEKGITNGTSPITFSPNATCTRGQVAAFLWRASGSPEPQTTQNPFSDVSAASVFYKPILWACENQITVGTTPTTFSPGGLCTRAHVLTFLWRASGEPGSADSALSRQYPGRFFTDALAWAESSRLLAETGPEYIGGSVFNPTDPCPRADIVTYMYRTLD